MIDQHKLVEYDGKLMAIKNIPDRFTRNQLGYGHGKRDCDTRQQHRGIGLYMPEVCIRADETKGVWINNGGNLVCPGCGLDYT